MAQVKIYDIALDLGVCPECLIAKVDELGIDTFSSRIKFDELLNVKSMPAARNPASYENSWIYYCDAHNAEYADESTYTNHEQTVEIEDVIDDSLQVTELELVEIQAELDSRIECHYLIDDSYRSKTRDTVKSFWKVFPNGIVEENGQYFATTIESAKWAEEMGHKYGWTVIH